MRAVILNLLKKIGLFILLSILSVISLISLVILFHKFPLLILFFFGGLLCYWGYRRLRMAIDLWRGNELCVEDVEFFSACRETAKQAPQYIREEMADEIFNRYLRVKE